MSEITTLDHAETVTPEQLDASATFIEAEFGKHGRKGKGSRVPAAQKAQVYTLFDVGKLSPAAIAESLGMSRLTVNAVLQHRDASALFARNLMSANSLRFVSNWITASDKGAAKGRHEPARDALYALNVVQPPSQVQAHQSVTVVLSGGEMPNELRVGIQQVTRLSPPSTD